ncbi:hypothetical protein SAMN05216383_10787 [Prevotella sp. KH2C16]|nr:hypothetical protein SAMN05216383_10787 [Prevotella sp. KH2C16]
MLNNMMSFRGILLCLSVLMSMHVIAQVNPKDGYIITNEGDTIRGIVDYRSDIRNAGICSFKASGSEQYKDYLPGEIQEFRLSDNGVYYVSRSFPVEGKEKTFFAEYLIKGTVSLYHHKEGLKDYYYIVDANGRVAEIRGLERYYLNQDDKKAVIKQNMASIIGVFNKTPEIVSKLNHSRFKSSEISKIIKDYNLKYCVDGGECVVFEYDRQEAASEKVRFKVQAGIDFSSLTLGSDYVEDFRMHSVIPVVGAGLEFWFSRTSHKLCGEAFLNFSSFSKSFAYDAVNEYGTERVPNASLRFSNLEEQVGIAYHPSREAKLSPVVRCGLSVNERFSSKPENLDYYSVGASTGMDFDLGYYAGAGLEMPIGKHFMELSVRYTLKKYSRAQMTYNGLGMYCSFIF